MQITIPPWIKVGKSNTDRDEEKRTKSAECYSRRRFLVRHSGPQLPDKVVAFSEQRIDTALTLGNIGTNVELPIHSHVINRVKLH